MYSRVHLLRVANKFCIINQKCHDIQNIVHKLCSFLLLLLCVLGDSPRSFQWPWMALRKSLPTKYKCMHTFLYKYVNLHRMQALEAPEVLLHQLLLEAEIHAHERMGLPFSMNFLRGGGRWYVLVVMISSERVQKLVKQDTGSIGNTVCINKSFKI